MRVPRSSGWLAVALVVGLVAACNGSPPDLAPAAPTNVSVSAAAGVLLVSWEHDGANVTGFVVYREVVAAGDASVRRSALTELAQVGGSARSYGDEQVTVGTAYRYAVAAKGTGARLSAPATQTGAPLAPEPVADTIADYEVGPGQVAVVTSITGVIEGFAGDAVDATFAGATGSSSCSFEDDDPACYFQPGGIWVPVSIDASGSFAIDLPSSPVIPEGGRLNVCGFNDPLIDNAVLYVHEAPFGEPGSKPTSSYARFRGEEPRVMYGMLYDASVLVSYVFVENQVDALCTEASGGYGEEDLQGDIDLRLRPGWNVVTWLLRSEGEDMVLYLRSGEPGLSVPWRVPEPAAATQP